MDKHLSRKELIKVARSGELPERGHLATCEQCRNEVLLLREYYMANQKPLPDAPQAWIKKAIDIARATGAGQKIRHLLAKIVFDSWKMPYPVGVRGEESLSDRRIRFEAEGLTLDIRAEKYERNWTFVAEISGKDIAGSEVILEADSRKYVPGAGGLYQWSSKRAPKKILLHSRNSIIELPELKWQKPRRK
jgi:hypothetical protein